MEKICIVVESEELEKISIELTADEVLALYKLRKEQTAKIAELEKQAQANKNTLEYLQKQQSQLQEEISEANTLLTALGIQEKTNAEESYYRKDLNVSTRIALLLGGIKDKTA